MGGNNNLLENGVKIKHEKRKKINKIERQEKRKDGSKRRLLASNYNYELHQGFALLVVLEFEMHVTLTLLAWRKEVWATVSLKLIMRSN